MAAKEPWMGGLFPADAWSPDNITEPTSDEERDIVTWLQPDEKIMWQESKVTRRKNMATLLRRLALLRKSYSLKAV